MQDGTGTYPQTLLYLRGRTLRRMVPGYYPQILMYLRDRTLRRMVPESYHRNQQEPDYQGPKKEKELLADMTTFFAQNCCRI